MRSLHSIARARRADAPRRKQEYQIAKSEDRLEEALQMQQAIKEFEADQENNGVAASIGAELCPPPPRPFCNLHLVTFICKLVTL